MMIRTPHISETEWDKIASYPLTRRLVQDMAELLVETNYTSGHRFVRVNLEPYWSAYLFVYATYLRERSKND